MQDKLAEAYKSYLRELNFFRGSIPALPEGWQVDHIKTLELTIFEIEIEIVQRDWLNSTHPLTSSESRSFDEFSMRVGPDWWEPWAI